MTAFKPFPTTSNNTLHVTFKILGDVGQQYSVRLHGALLLTSLANNIGSCWLKRLTAFKPFLTTPNNTLHVTFRILGDVGQQCRVRLHGALLLTSLAQQCWELLAQKFDRFQTFLNNSQQHAGQQCSVRLHGALLLTSLAQQCWVLLHPFARSLNDFISVSSGLLQI